jgi:hypothetical protein
LSRKLLDNQTATDKILKLFLSIFLNEFSSVNVRLAVPERVASGTLGVNIHFVKKRRVVPSGDKVTCVHRPVLFPYSASKACPVISLSNKLAEYHP